MDAKTNSAKTDDNTAVRLSGVRALELARNWLNTFFNLTATTSFSPL